VVRFLILASASAGAAGTAAAASPATGTDTELQEVIVTGSRLSTGFTTPTPVTVLGADLIEELNITNVGAGANELPAFCAGDARRHGGPEPRAQWPGRAAGGGDG